MDKEEAYKQVFALEYLFKEFNTLINKYSSSKDYVGCIFLEVVLSLLRSMMKILWLLFRLVEEMCYMLEACIQ